VSSLTIALFLQASLLGAGGNNYNDAHRETVETGKPLLVMVGADWCGPCQQMKKSILPQVDKHGMLKNVSFAHVNVDKESELARKLTGGGPVPQLVMLRKTDDGWRKRKLIGGQSVDTVEKFIREAVAQNETDQAAKAHATTANKAASPIDAEDDKVEVRPVSSR
jgi:thioredoxin-like negative regulator of GroEL